MNEQELQIQVFGQLTEVIGKTNINLPYTGTTGQFKTALLQAYPALANNRFVIAVDKQVLQEDGVILPGAKIALLPPFSGG
ncbi:MoaD/ThiS family protein [Flavihumibacter sp. CACIAM 22H1]|uniref:MoaD/ThiS family protein n=1 Tax=Flavihumibacter sp. CACIAM 22H1 TaxID=1812911 RepID=UPI0007A8C4CC|nr:MoaD/ThiS family protein [Flavihumibacter sp. CACIAM 22H1]KYP14712.1 MAG: hypothetical protein A1D16_14840 [Flavihumibacter sp. CACIAM 22H1]